MVQPRSCRVIYYFDTPTLRRRHQSFGRVSNPQYFKEKKNYNVKFSTNSILKKIKSTKIILEKIIKKNKKNHEKNKAKKNHVGKHCSNPQCFKGKKLQS